MNIIIKKTLDVTPALETYISEKFGPVEKLLKSFEEKGELTLHCEISRATEHHKKGENIFAVSVLLTLPGKGVRGDGEASDARVAIDRARDVLKEEIEKYKAKYLETYRGGKTR